MTSRRAPFTVHDRAHKKTPHLRPSRRRVFLDSCNLPWRERADTHCIATNGEKVDLASTGWRSRYGKENPKSAEQVACVPITL
jgi:hypothetical protein